MMRAPIAALLTICASTGLLTACAGSPPKPTSVPVTAAAQAPLPVPSAGQAVGTPPPAQTAPAASAPAAAIGSATAPSPAASVPTDGVATSGSASAPDSATAPGSVTPAGPVASVATPMASPESATPPSPNEPAAAASAATPPAPVPQAPASAPALRVLLADELPYAPTRLRAHDAKSEHHRAREANRESPGSAREKRPYHPAPGIVVDVVDAQGGSTAAALQRAARNLGYWPFRQCYEEGLRRDPRLAGKVALELVVSPSGAVDRSVVTASTVHDEIVAACVAREAQRLALPTGDSPKTTKVDVSLAVGDEPVPAGRPVPAAEPIRDTLRGSWGAVRRCYASRLAVHPGIGGRLELHFHVRHGEIVDVDELGTAAEGRFGDAEVTRCLIGIYRKAKLPASHGQRERSFVYALHFESVPIDAATP